MTIIYLNATAFAIIDTHAAFAATQDDALIMRQDAMPENQTFPAAAVGPIGLPQVLS